MAKKFLKNLTHFGLGGPARVFVLSSTSALPAFLRETKKNKQNFFVLGGGTNVIAHDAGFKGVVLQIKTNSLHVRERTIECDAGVSLRRLIRAANRKGLEGLETLAGIPGTVGGAIYGNAGAYGKEIANVIKSVSVYDGKKIHILSKKECVFGYRESFFKKKPWVILSAVFSFKKRSGKKLAHISKNIIALRRKKYKPGLRCAGSIFKNILLKSAVGERVKRMIPKEKIIKGKIPAGVLLEGVGAKGMKKGGIQVADFHANLIFNAGNGTAKDAKYLIEKLKRNVYKKYGVMLEEEVRYMGF